MKSAKYLSLMLISLIMLSLTACKDNEEESGNIPGTWISDEETVFVVNADGTALIFTETSDYYAYVAGETSDIDWMGANWVLYNNRFTVSVNTAYINGQKYDLPAADVFVIDMNLQWNGNNSFVATYEDGTTETFKRKV